MSILRKPRDLWQCSDCLAWTPMREARCRSCDRARVLDVDEVLAEAEAIIAAAAVPDDPRHVPAPPFVSPRLICPCRACQR